MTLKNKLQSIIDKTNPKQTSKTVIKNTELKEWVMTHVGDTVSEKIYNALNNVQTTCVNGNKKKFKSLSLGYGFCAKTKDCMCAKQSVSEKISKAKLQYTAETKNNIQEKKINTLLKKYNVINAGQTAYAKAKHSELYCDAIKTEHITNQIKQTKEKNHNDPNFNNSTKIKETYRQKRNDKFWINKFPEKNISLLENKDQLLDLYNKHTPIEIADQLSVHVQTVYRYLNFHNIREPFKSTDEQELVRFINELGISNIIRNTRKLLPSKKEIDIFLPDLNIAIEYNGVYWHHEDVNHITRDYHFNKFKECEELGIQLITIFSNFWHNKKDIVKNILRVKLHCYQNNAVYARKCIVKQINNKDSKDFLNNYHIQGYTPADTCLGLYYNDRLVSIMSFASARMGIGKASADIELVRFATSELVAGGASKLLAFYKKLNSGVCIISYSDNEWSTGLLYKTLGFELTSEIKYSYWYLKPREHKLYHRFTFSKQKLIKQGHDPAKTEAEITKEMGLLKVWDCGKRKWLLK